MPGNRNEFTKSDQIIAELTKQNKGVDELKAGPNSRVRNGLIGYRKKDKVQSEVAKDFFENKAYLNEKLNNK